jgi:hypothetical protein
VDVTHACHNLDRELWAAQGIYKGQGNQEHGDYMVSWGRAFRGAAGIVGFAIIWWILGGVLVVAGIYLSGIFSMFYGSAGSSFLGIGLGSILIFIGYIIGILGTIAAFLKVLPEIVAEEVQERTG